MNVNEYLSNWAACYKKDLTEHSSVLVEKRS